MQKFTTEMFSTLGSEHIASEPHMRIQIVIITNHYVFSGYFDNYHGELLIIVLEGRINLRTSSGLLEELTEGDQALLVDGEGFNITKSSPSFSHHLWSDTHLGFHWASIGSQWQLHRRHLDWWDEYESLQYVLNLPAL